MITLITGMSATGKSTLIAALGARGHAAVDLDAPAYSEYRQTAAGREWMWREDAVEALLRAADGPLFVSGCASNQGRFYPMFTHIVLLTAPVDIMLDRLATRTTNTYGKRPEQIDEVLANTRDIEPMLRQRATLILDTTAPLEDTLAAIVGLLA